MQVEIAAGEPWEFVEAHGEGPFPGQIVRVGYDYWVSKLKNRNKEAVLIQLDTPFNVEDTTFEYLIASPRLETGDIHALVQGSEVYCGISCIPTDRAIGADPFDLSWWHKGIGLIGTVRRK
jgi:hypothetical protein